MQDEATKFCRRCERTLPVSAFYTSSGNRHPCIECFRTADRMRRAANPEKYRTQKRRAQARARAANPEVFRERQRRWRASNREYVRQKARGQYRKDREKIAARHVVRKAARRKWFDGLKTDPCADCGGTFPPSAMDFHHVNGDKDFTVAKQIMIAKRRIEAEIAKCVLLCANCHRIRHHEAK